MNSSTLVNVTGTAKTGKHFNVDAYVGPTNDASAAAATAATRIKTAMEATGAFTDINLTIRETPLS
jgi:3-methyladenine DNA glycosylase Mpg